MSSADVFTIEPEQVRPLKRSEYHQMIGLGLFQNERVELIRGVLVKMSPQHAPHASTIQELAELLTTQLQKRFKVRSPLPLALSDDTEPEPDIAVVTLGKYQTEHPTTALLVIEVSDSSLKADRRKAAVYASASVGEYWIVNLAARTVEVYSSPERGRFTEVRTLRPGDVLRPSTVPDVEIAVSEILPDI